MTNFSSSFGAPTDPAYLKFLDKLKQLDGKPVDTGVWRWSPKETAWRVYDSTWVIQDLGVPDTSPERVVRRAGYMPDSWIVEELFVPELFARVQKAYESLAKQYPSATLVWTPWGDGDWRNVFQGGTGSVPNRPGGQIKLPQGCLDQIEKVREFERRGMITHDQCQRMINSIVEECT